MSFEPTEEQKKRIELAREIIEQAIKTGTEYRSDAFIEKCTSEQARESSLIKSQGVKT